ncbi:MAG: hypothetical protein AAB426_08285 [Myxococcota bacterium]
MVAALHGNVKGTLFVDYVRMLRAHKNIDWSTHLLPEDLAHLHETIRPGGWYPMATFERFGLAILAEIAQGNLAAVRAFGRASIDAMAKLTLRNLIVEGDPRATLMRFKVYRSDFFDFPAVDILQLVAKRARVRVAYGMSAAAEEAACHQTMGFFERMAELAGAHNCQASFTTMAWRGDDATVIELGWE